MGNKPVEANPILHFLRQPHQKLENPHALFDCSFYLRTNPDVVREGYNPLIHFLLIGAKESRDPHPLFSLDF